MTHATYDLIVIGGGINGAGIAQEAATRGLTVLLLEKYDFGSGTTSWSSRLIHGGLRYLEYGELPLVYESLHERRKLLRNAPHLVVPLRITIPIFADSERGLFLVRLGMMAYDLLSVGKDLPRHRMLNAGDVIERFPAIRRDGLKGAASYFDAQLQFAERLVLEIVLAAAAAGALCRSYCEVEEITHQSACVTGVRFRDRGSGESESVSARMVVNAAGPWVDRVLATVTNDGLPHYMGGTKGSHIIVPRFPGAPDDALYVEAKQDKRPIFIIPWYRQMLIGTTDIRIEEDPADVRASPAEIDYLIAEANRVFPAAGLSRNSVSYTYSGVRPLPRQTEGPESAITRKHIIKHHNHLARGLYSIIGGKLTTYRSLAEDLVDLLNRDFDLSLPGSVTSEAALPGATGYDDFSRELNRKAGRFSTLTREHLLAVYGTRAADVLDLANKESALAATICEWSGAIAAEIPFAIREEFATSLDDVLNRRTMIGLGPDRGLTSAEAVARLMAPELGWSEAMTRQKLDEYAHYVASHFLPNFTVPDSQVRSR